MFKDNDSIDHREAFFFIIAALIEVGTLTGISSLVKGAGPDAWLVFLGGYLLAVPSILITVKLGQRFYKHGFGEYSRIISGKVFGFILSAVVIIYWLFVTARTLRSLTDIVNLVLLHKTPPAVISFSILALAVYISRYGIEPQARLSILLVLTVVPAIAFLCLIILPQVKLDNFLPFLAEGPWSALKSAVKEIGDWEEISYFLILIPFMNKPEKAVKVAIWGSFVIAVFVLLVISISIGVMGTDITQHQMAAPVSALEIADFPGLSVERLGIIFSSLWIIIAFPTLSSLLFVIAVVLSQIFGTKEHKQFIIPLVPIVYFVSRIPGNPFETETLFKILTPLGIAVLLFIPLMLYTIALVRGVKDS